MRSRCANALDEQVVTPERARCATLDCDLAERRVDE